MSDDSSRFGLTNLSDGIRRRYAELSHDKTPESKSIATDLPGGPRSYEQADYDRIEPDKDDLRKYWRLFETTPIVRKPINSFASRVLEPGYYFNYPEELQTDEYKDARRNLRHFAKTCGIVEGEINQDFTLLAKKAVVEKEVRGTYFTEKVPARGDDDSLAGLKLINSETMEVVTRPNQAILIAPEDADREDFEDVPETEDGEGAAYLQDIYETRNSFLDSVTKTDTGVNKVPFTKNEIIKDARDADIGEVFGTSRIEAVSDRIDGIKKKLSDHDEAIASKAYPLWLFMFGDPETGLWDNDDIENFMKHHEMDNFHPGMKQGVRGDVSVEPISGEVADIADSLQFDVNWIMSAMPMPKYALGGFGESVGQVAGVAQQSDVQRQIREERQQLERKFEPVFHQKAMDYGIDEELARDIEFKIGKQGETDMNPDANQQIVRYVGKDDGGIDAVKDMNGMSDPQQRREDDGPQTDVDIDVDAVPKNSSGQGDSSSSQDESTDSQSEQSAATFSPEQFEESGVWAHEFDVAELAHYDSTSHEAELAVTVSDVVTNVRDDVLERVDESNTDIERIANRAIEKHTSNNAYRRTVEDSVEASLSEADKMYDGESLMSQYSKRTSFERNVKNAVRDFAEEMVRRMRVQIRHGLESDESYGDIKQRVYNRYSDADIYNRSQLIARMECRECRESAKLEMFEQADDVVGIKFPDESHSHEVCKRLAGTSHRFADDVRESMRIETSGVSKDDEFDPLPVNPPYHYGCTMSMEPVYEAKSGERND